MSLSDLCVNKSTATVVYGGAAELEKIKDTDTTSLTFRDAPDMVSEVRVLDTVLGKVVKWTISPLKDLR